MKYIFLDTNIFFNNWHLKSADFRFLFNYLKNTDSVLLMSELVCEEVENIRIRELESSIEILKKELKRTKKHNLIPLDFDFDKLSAEEYNIKELLHEKIDKIDFISYENIKQNDVVRRALKKIKPFLESEKGYRDTLIWLSFIEYLSKKEIKDEVIFITNNKTDFFNKDVNDFHDDLKLDIATFKLKCSIKPYNSLYSFITENVDKVKHGITYSELYDEHLCTIDCELEGESLDYINNISESKFKDILNNNSLRTFPHINSLLSHSLELMEGVEDPEILSYKPISKDTVYVSSRFNLRICILELTIPTSDYYINRNQIDRSYFEICSDDTQTTLVAYVRTYLDVSFEYNKLNKTIEGFDIETIDFK